MKKVILTLAALLWIFSPASEASAEVLNIGYQPNLHHLAEMVAAEKGWWSEGLLPLGITEIREFEFPSGATEMQAMLVGGLDVAYVGTAPPIIAISRGLDAKIVAGVNVQGSSLVLRRDLAYEGPKSLQGLTIATNPPGSIQDLVLRKWFQEKGIDLKTTVILDMTAGDAVIALSEGAIDGFFMPQPIPAIVDMEGQGKYVVASGGMWPEHACCSILVSGRLIRDRPDLVRKIVQIHTRATDYINHHPEEVAGIYSNRTGQDLELVKYAMKTWDGRWISDPGLQVPSAVKYAAMDFNLNYTDKVPTKDDLFDTSFYGGPT